MPRQRIIRYICDLYSVSEEFINDDSRPGRWYNLRIADAVDDQKGRMHLVCCSICKAGIGEKNTVSRIIRKDDSSIRYPDDPSEGDDDDVV